jgi:hypothetical protein
MRPGWLRRPDRTAFRNLLVALSCLVAAACSQQEVLQKVTSPQDRALTIKLIQALQSGDTAYLMASLPPELGAKLAPVLPKMRDALPSGRGAALRLVDGNFNFMSVAGGATTRRSYLAYEVDQGSRHALVRLGILRQGQNTTVTDLYVNSLTKPVGELTAFSLTGKSAAQYLFLAIAFLSLVTVVTSLVVLFRSKDIKPKWLWTIGCLFGFGKFAVDWSSGAMTFAPLNVQLFGAFAVKIGMLSAWQVGFGVPIFAIALLLRQGRTEIRRRRRALVPPETRSGT